MFPAYFSIAFFALLVVAVTVCFSARQFYYKIVEDHLRIQGEILSTVINTVANTDNNPTIRTGDSTGVRSQQLDSGGVKEKQFAQLERLLADYEARTGYEYTVFIGETRSIPARDFSVDGRIQVSIPLEIARTESIGSSDTPVLRVSIKTAITQADLNRLYLRVILLCLVLLIALPLSHFIISRRVTEPVEQIKKQADRFSKGDMTSRVYLGPGEAREFYQLGKSINKMAAQLDRRMEMVVSQKNELYALLGSLRDGVLSFDDAGRIRHANESAAKMLGIRNWRPQGKSVEEVFRNPKVIRLVRESLAGAQTVETEVEVHGEGEEKIVRVHATPLRNEDGTSSGSVVVLSDFTELKRLEEHRQEFVANVSHELRTPLTSIQGFAETLLNQKVEDEQERERFLKIIHRHAARLTGIVEDLLSLARIEKEEFAETLVTENRRILPILASALQVIEPKAEEVKIQLHLDCDERLWADVRADLLEQAVVNLVENAIKYSDPRSSVWVAARHEGENLLITVRDQGMGISEEHKERLFERFYRVDKARSRKAGGTGLGLSIVKHIVQAHGGRILLESELGRGSTFTIEIPLRSGREPAPPGTQFSEEKA